MRQGQSLVMTPQLLQAIKLLQLSTLDLANYVDAELERNPLLEREEDASEGSPIEAPAPDLHDDGYDESHDQSHDNADFTDAYLQTADSERHDTIGSTDADWAKQGIETEAVSLAENLGDGSANAFEVDRPTQDAETVVSPLSADGLSATSWTGAGGGVDGEDPNLEAYVASRLSLRDHLANQLSIACKNVVDRSIGHAIIDCIEDTGYLKEPLADIAERLGATLQRCESMLSIIQTFEPGGVGARDLAECLAIQLRERDHLDPAMQALLAHLPLVARRDFASLRKICGVDDEDLIDMIAEIRRLEPKPGRQYGAEPVQAIVPDVTVRAAADGSWRIDLNAEGLPRVLVNQTYAAHVARSATSPADKSFLTTCLQDANWLTKSLEQRARTILKVATEIVRQQDSFFMYGVEHLRPLNLKSIADAIGMHESTISRVTSNKYMATPRGVFELKYFFTASIPSGSAGREAHSAAAVRYKIKQMIDAETVDGVLSDDAIVARLKGADVVIARRTVAKYREFLRIPSSVERRREKSALQRSLA